jgi:hypothetical protein
MLSLEGRAPLFFLKLCLCARIEHGVQKTGPWDKQRMGFVAEEFGASLICVFCSVGQHLRPQNAAEHWHCIRSLDKQLPSPRSAKSTAGALMGFRNAAMRDSSGATLSRPRVRPFTAVHPKEGLQVRSVRPSVVDLRFSGDPWILAGKDGRFALYLGEYALVSISGSVIDLPALNGLLDRLRHRRPRRRACSARGR